MKTASISVRVSNHDVKSHHPPDSKVHGEGHGELDIVHLEDLEDVKVHADLDRGGGHVQLGVGVQVDAVHVCALVVARGVVGIGVFAANQANAEEENLIVNVCISNAGLTKT